MLEIVIMAATIEMHPMLLEERAPRFDQGFGIAMGAIGINLKT